MFRYIMKNMTKYMPDIWYLKLKYYLSTGKKLNLKNPKDYNEKLQWLKLYDRRPEYIKYVDKYAVREYIASTIGEEYLIPVLGIYDEVEEIDWEKLPNQFVLKCTHGSGCNIVCVDKNKLDIAKSKKELKKWMKNSWFWYGREWPYKQVKPKILCEEYMVDESGTELKDYKFMCFNGEVKCLFVCLNRNKVEGLNVDFYDLNWKPMPFERKYPRSNVEIPKPKSFGKMIELSKKLAKDIPFVRVDFYEIQGKIYFGELTFYPGSGFEKFKPEQYDRIIGDWIELPKNKIV